jgi:hypothetical protein
MGISNLIDESLFRCDLIADSDLEGMQRTSVSINA